MRMVVLFSIVVLHASSNISGFPQDFTIVYSDVKSNKHGDIFEKSRKA